MLNSSGFAHGLSTAPLASRLRGAGGGAVDNPAHCLSDHKSKEDIPFRSHARTCIGLTTSGIEWSIYIGSIAVFDQEHLGRRSVVVDHDRNGPYQPFPGEQPLEKAGQARREYPPNDKGEPVEIGVALYEAR